MSEVKTFIIAGEVKKPTGLIRFTKKVKGLREEEAVERLLCDVGSRHRAKRFEIRILKIEEKKE
ncbi:50S ribosomal protein L18a [Candidatus Bathyarchaeota archaeon]|nr:50S ribosomal protein L18a [Candidatus Bathyarchaeota archaeon]MBS7628470.1 50S ribosomal protein L18a [Candidatus Bathyarchaeota archaeon]